jgi:hypothetical protein
MLVYKNDSDVISLVTAFEERTLLKENWTHAAHLTVALYYCLHYPFGVAKNLMSDGIHWLNDTHGTPNTETSGYHETLTVFWMRTVKEFLDKHEGSESLAMLANDLVALCNDSKLPLKFYSRELLFSPHARACYVEPDLATAFEFGNLFYDNFAPEVFA